jgi:hypothetical protein
VYGEVRRKDDKVLFDLFNVDVGVPSSSNSVPFLFDVGETDGIFKPVESRDGSASVRGRIGVGAVIACKLTVG